MTATIIDHRIVCELHPGTIENKGTIDEGVNSHQLTVKLWANCACILCLCFLSINGDNILTIPYND